MRRKTTFLTLSILTVAITATTRVVVTEAEMTVDANLIVTSVYTAHLVATVTVASVVIAATYAEGRTAGPGAIRNKNKTTRRLDLSPKT